MRLKINVFTEEERARNLDDLKGDDSIMYHCTDGAKLYDFAGLNFLGNSYEELWIVVVEEEE